MRVMAVTLTFNAPEALEDCLARVREQLGVEDRLLVVDNASTPPASIGIRQNGEELVRLEENLGPAGGYARAVELFLQSDAEYIWFVDDDVNVPPGALDRLVARSLKEGSTTAVWPLLRRPDGSIVRWPTWCGPLLPRQLVCTLGLPREDFFWWAEDSEYLQWRLMRLGGSRAFAEDVTIDHVEVRRGKHKPTWKFYYETRNIVFYRFHLQIARGGWPKRRMARRAVTAVAKAAARVVRDEPEKTRKLVAIGRGVLDGALGRLGRRADIGPWVDS